MNFLINYYNYIFIGLLILNTILYFGRKIFLSIFFSVIIMLFHFYYLTETKIINPFNGLTTYKIANFHKYSNKKNTSSKDKIVYYRIEFPEKYDYEFVKEIKYNGRTYYLYRAYIYNGKRIKNIEEKRKKSLKAYFYLLPQSDLYKRLIEDSKSPRKIRFLYAIVSIDKGYYYLDKYYFWNENDLHFLNYITLVPYIFLSFLFLLFFSLKIALLLSLISTIIIVLIVIYIFFKYGFVLVIDY